MAKSQSTAARLFDKVLFSEPPTQDPTRMALGTIPNGSKSGRKTRNGDKASGDVSIRKQRIADRIKERIKPAVQFESPKMLWERGQLRSAEPKRTKAPRKNKNYPDCTKDALLKAFEMAGLPDYDKIMEHELHMTVIEPWEVKRPYIEKPSTPPMKDLLAVFDATQSTMSANSVRSTRQTASATIPKPPSVSPAKKRRTRKSQKEQNSETVEENDSTPVGNDLLPEMDPVIEDSPVRERRNVSTLDKNQFRLGIKNPTMASTPLVTGGARLPSFSAADPSSIRQASRQGGALTEESTLTEPKTFLGPRKEAPKPIVKTSISKSVLLVSREIADDDSDTEVSQEKEERTLEDKSRGESGGSKESSLEKSKVSKTKSKDSIRPSRGVSLEESSREADTIIEAPVKRKSSQEKVRQVIKTTTIEICPNSDEEDEAEKSLPLAAILFDKLTNRSCDRVSGTSSKNGSGKSSRDGSGKKDDSIAKSTPRRSPRSQSTTVTPGAVETLGSRLSLDDSVPTILGESGVSKLLLRRPSNLSSFFGCSSFQTPSSYRTFNVVTDRRLHPTLKNMTLNSSKLGSTFLGNQTGFGNMTALAKSAKKRRFKSIVPDLTNSKRVTKVSMSESVAVNDPLGLGDLIRNSVAAAFNQTKVIFDDGKEEQLEPMDKVLALCDPPEIIPFEGALSKKFLKNISKIGEGSYGEVYKSTDAKGGDIILKIVPFDPEKSQEEVFAQLLPELVICSTFNLLRTNNLNKTPNFINMTKTVVVEGRFPQVLLDKWDEYDQRKTKGSENPDPGEYGDDHLHSLMFLTNGGTDLESVTFKSGLEALSVLLQVAFSLAAAELEYQFEHRDLHVGNVLVMATKEEKHVYLVDGANYVVPTTGVTASIIDFSLSRLSKDGFVIHQDLSTDEELFNGSGDVQFDIYRKMKEETGNKWERFCPKTNIFWLHYLVGKLLEKKFKSKAKVHDAAIKTLKSLEKKILGYESCHQLILNKVIDEAIEVLQKKQ